MYYVMYVLVYSVIARNNLLSLKRIEAAII